MSVKRLGLGTMGLCWALAASCAQDSREVSLAFPLLNGGGGAAGNADASVAPVDVGGGTSDDSPSESVQSAPVLAVGPPSIDLGWVTTGFPSRARVTVSNSGNAPMNEPEVSWLSGSDAEFEIIQNQCLGELAPGASCELRVQLLSARAGALQANLHVQASGAGAADVSLSGLGLPAGALSLVPAVGSFENFGRSLIGLPLENAFTVSNPSAVSSGPLTFNVNRPEFGLLPVAAGDCVSGVTALVNGETCTLRLAFTPLERGPIEATLVTASDGAGSVSLTLTGRGLAPAALSASSPALDFDGVVLQQGAQRRVSFENSGDEPLALANVHLLPETVEDFSIRSSDCAEGTVLAGGQSCNVIVEFRPPRTNEEMTAELIATSAVGDQSQTVAMRGIGLDSGSLVAVPVNEGENDFGDVRLRQSLVRAFRIDNPSAQPSGVLTLSASAGYELVTPPEEGDCVAGATSLVDGQSCTVRVRFAPLDRRVVNGSLTVTSLLTGAVALPLIGRGISAASLEVDNEVNFGRVLTNASGLRTLTLRNAGDEPLPPPTPQLSTSTGAPATVFSYQSRCSLPLAYGEECTVDLTFAPTLAVPHRANFLLSTPGGTTDVLLLGEAQLPGSLVLAPAEGNSVDFGDVALDTTSTRSFVLTNPTALASGPLTISTDDSRFEPQLGDCNQGDPAGLVDGASCSFSVQFVPNDSLQAVANLSVQSPGAGRAGLQISGRGRLGPTLSATGSRDLGRATVGQTDALSDFTWTVNNVGDLPSGALSVQILSTTINGQPEFDVRNDSCSASVVPGRSSCQMLISFHPGAPGARTGRVVVTDPTGGSAAPLVLTGQGVQIAGPGESCVNAECSTGTCTRGVCCDRQCDRTCQVCSNAGVCVDQSNREACGTGGAACFGVDNCKLAEGAACSANNGDAQCGSGNCEQRLGGSGANDRICCLDDCLGGQLCNAQGRCQDPALGAGAACGAPGAQPCAAGLQCKSCRGGGNQCTAPNDCCGDCDFGLECSAGSCQCPIASNGRRGIPCGNGLCAIDRENACCPGSAPAGCNCDTRDNLCKQCLVASDCPAGGTGTRRECNGNTCSNPCDTPAFKACNNTCIAANACCGGCGAGQTCVNAQCLIDPGQVCNGGGAACSTGICSAAEGGGSRCCSRACAAGELCNTQGQCVLQQVLSDPGASCKDPAVVCATPPCIEAFRDVDMDGFAAESALADPERFCTEVPMGWTTREPVSRQTIDCCDVAGGGDFHPGQTTASSTPVSACMQAGGGFDRDCSGTAAAISPVQNRAQNCPGTSVANCTNGGGGYVPRSSCGALMGGDPNETVPECGQTGCIAGCAVMGGVCAGTPGGTAIRLCL